MSVLRGNNGPRWRDFGHIPKSREWLAGQVNERTPENGFGLPDKPAVTRDVDTVELLDFSEDTAFVAGVIKPAAVRKDDPVIRITGDDLQVVSDVSSGKAEQFLDQKRRRDDRRTGIKGKPVLFINVRPTTRFVPHFEQVDIVPARLQTNGRS
jgi:hypothetical protein